jgi:hypothetical protein
MKARYSELMQFLSDREKRNEWSGLISEDGSELNLTALSKETGISRSSLYQNKKIVSAIDDVEARLKRNGILRIASQADDRFPGSRLEDGAASPIESLEMALAKADAVADRLLAYLQLVQDDLQRMNT